MTLLRLEFSLKLASATKKHGPCHSRQDHGFVGFYGFFSEKPGTAHAVTGRSTMGLNGGCTKIERPGETDRHKKSGTGSLRCRFFSGDD